MTDLVVNLAPTGVVPTREKSPSVPLTPAEVVTDVLACAEIGITSVHLHARDESGQPTWRPEPYAEMIAGIREARPDLVIGVSCSGRAFGAFEQRSAVLDLDDDLKPDMASLTLSSLNFLRAASVNEPDMVRRLAEKMRDRGIRPELEAFDLGMLNVARHLIDQEVLEPPYCFNLFFGNVAGARVEVLDIAAMVSALPPDSIWCGAGIGAGQRTVNAIAIALDAGVRVGLEDCLHLDAERTRPASNPALVERVAQLADVHDRPVMEPSTYRALIG